MRWLAPLALAAAAAAVYANSLPNPFVFDDEGAIVENRHLRHLWPLAEALSSPPQATVAGRPLVSLTLALNHAVSGLDVRGFRILNLAVHIACGLALYGLVRRSIAGLSLDARPDAIAFSTALIWLVHPLGTETIDYVVQRTESIMALCYLLTLYASVRAARSARPAAWSAAAILACAAGMASKESMVTAPVAVVLHDIAYRGGPWRALLARRRALYLGLGATWLLLAALMWGGPRSETVGFDVGISPLDYARNQCVIVVDYLRTALWPHPLVFDYGDARPLGTPVAVPWGLLLALLVGGSLLTFWRRPALGFPAVWVFLTLAPTSSVVPIASEVGAERRMYLPLAGLVVLAVVAVARATRAAAGRIGRPRLAPRLALAVLAVGAFGLGLITARRNLDYRTNEAIWQSAVRARPDNPRAHGNLGQAVHVAGRVTEALDHYGRALELDPDYAQAHFNLGVALADLGRTDEAVDRYRRALALNPTLGRAHHNLASELANRGRIDEAIGHFREAVRLAPESVEARQGLGRALRLAGAVGPALAELREAVRLDPDRAEPLADIAWILATDAEAGAGRAAESIDLAQRAVALTGERHAISLDTLAAAYAAAGRFAEARETADRAQEVARSKGAYALAAEIAQRRALYERGLPFREGNGRAPRP